MDSDDGFLPRGLGFAVGSVGILASIVVLFAYSHRRPIQPEPPPWVVTGCYSTPDGPDIFVDQTKLRVLQNPAVETDYKLEYIKGWAFSADSRLDVETGANGIAKIVPISDFGEYLSLSREGEVAAKTPGFHVLSRSQALTWHYTWTGPSCAVIHATSSPPLKGRGF